MLLVNVLEVYSALSKGSDLELLAKIFNSFQHLPILAESSNLDVPLILNLSLGYVILFDVIVKKS